MSESNPLLSKVRLPGKIFQLPSRGIFYKDGELSANVQDGEIHVRPLSAMAEITLKNPDQLFSGKAIESVFAECVEGVEKPGRLLAKDVDAILIFLRAVTYGDSYELLAQHSCADAKEHSYIISVEKMISDVANIDPTTIESSFTLTLNNGQVVRLQPNRYADLVAIIKNNQNRTEVTLDDEKRNLLDMLLGIIVSVDGISDRALVEEWLRAIPSPTITRIMNQVEIINKWGPSLLTEVECPDCKQMFTVSIPINPVSFFTE